MTDVSVADLWRNIDAFSSQQVESMKAWTISHFG